MSLLRVASLVPDTIMETGDDLSLAEAIAEVVTHCGENAREALKGDKSAASQDRDLVLEYTLGNKKVTTAVPTELVNKITRSFTKLGAEVLTNHEIVLEEDDVAGFLGRRTFPIGETPDVFNLQVRLVEADVRVREIWSTDLLPGKEPFDLILADPPFGLKMHASKNVVSYLPVVQ